VLREDTSGRTSCSTPQPSPPGRNRAPERLGDCGPGLPHLHPVVPRHSPGRPSASLEEVHDLPCPAHSPPAAIAATGPASEGTGWRHPGPESCPLPLTTKHCSTFSNARLLPCERCYTGVTGGHLLLPLDANGDVIDTWQKAAQLVQTQALKLSPSPGDPPPTSASALPRLVSPPTQTMR